LLKERGDDKAAVRLWQQFVEANPRDAEALNELGAALFRDGQTEEAIRQFRHAITIRKDFTSAKMNLGVALRQLGHLDEAISLFKAVLAAAPDNPLVCFNLGAVLASQQQNEKALSWLQRASDLSPGDADCAVELGKVLKALKRGDDAIDAYRRAVSLNPKSVEALIDLGGLLQEARQFDEAIERFQKVVELDPSHENGWIGLAGGYLEKRQYAEALAAFRRVLALQPGSVVAHCNMSLALAGLGRIDEAIEACRKAICIEPGSAVPTFNMGTLLLSQGRYREGWQAYNYRFPMGGEKWLKEDARAAPWMGEALAGKSILILGEQGNGDHIQFVRYLPALSDLGAQVTYVAPARLHRLLRTLHGSITLVSEAPKDSVFDYQCPLINLPGVFEELGMPVPNEPYLHAEPERVERWKERIGDHGFKIGVFWQGNTYKQDYRRSFPLGLLAPMAAMPDVRLISLQIANGSEQLDKLPAGMTVERLGPDFDSGEDGFLDAAAVIETMDLIVSCDTSIVHLAGALGKRVWIALNDAAEWRWRREGDDTVWYPTARLFRQEATGDWDGVFRKMTTALPELLNGDSALSAPTASAVVTVPDTLPAVSVSWGEFLDKMTILEIKAERITSPESRANVRRELDHLRSALLSLAPLPGGVEDKRQSLRGINEKLWDVEDAIRACEHDQCFDGSFVALARKIYALNDERASLKRQINILMKSAFVEEKEYTSTGGAGLRNSPLVAS